MYNTNATSESFSQSPFSSMCLHGEVTSQGPSDFFPLLWNTEQKAPTLN